MRTERMPYWNEAVVGVGGPKRAREGGGGLGASGAERAGARQSLRARPVSSPAAPGALVHAGGRTNFTR